MWMYDTGKDQAIHIEEVDTSTILDALIYPLRAIKGLGGNGKICQEVNNNSVAGIEITSKRTRKKRTQEVA
jgi:hypothetical protein